MFEFIWERIDAWSRHTRGCLRKIHPKTAVMFTASHRRKKKPNLRGTMFSDTETAAKATIGPGGDR